METQTLNKKTCSERRCAARYIVTFLAAGEPMMKTINGDIDEGLNKLSRDYKVTGIINVEAISALKKF